ncbi:MAG: hypothetical protein IJV99_00870 [Clostridia bacterium]|nr:hypothetical protein [Clostridia bacterium]
MMKIAFAGFGEVNTPVEFIVDRCAAAAESLKKGGAEVISCFPISDDYEEKDVNKAIDFFEGKDFDALVLCVAGWIPTHAVVKITERFRDKPMVLWGLCGWIESDGRLVTTADQAGTSALRKVMKDLGYTFKYVYNIIGKPSRVDEVLTFCKAASAYKQMRSAKIGHMGYRDMHLYGTLFDGLTLKKTIGAEIECFEMLEVVQRAEKITDSAIDEVINTTVNSWKFMKKADMNIVRRGVSYYLALKEIIDERKYVAVSLKDVDGMKKLLGFPPAMIFMLLADREGICTIPENDCLGNVTQAMIKMLTGQIGAYLEFYEFFEEGVLAGVPDYVPAEIVDGEVTVSPEAFGLLSQGVLNVSKVKTGTVTMCRLTTENGKYVLHMVVGEGTTPPKWEEAGWAQPAPQLPALKVLLKDTEDFTDKVMGQHYIISYGDNSKIITEFCKIAGIEII